MHGDKPTTYRVFYILLNDEDLETKLSCLSRLGSLSQPVVKELLAHILTAVDSLIQRGDWKIRAQIPAFYISLTNIMVYADITPRMNRS